MSQFYVGSETDAKRCRDSRDFRKALEITGLPLEGVQPELFKGVVRLVEEDTKHHSKRWRVLMIDSK